MLSFDNVPSSQQQPCGPGVASAAAASSQDDRDRHEPLGVWMARGLRINRCLSFGTMLVMRDDCDGIPDHVAAFRHLFGSEPDTIRKVLNVK